MSNKNSQEHWSVRPEAIKTLTIDHACIRDTKDMT